MATKKDILKDYNELLATTAVFSQKVHNIHWNIHGFDFMDIHELTDKIYEGLNDFIDDIAEKIVQQGGILLVTMKDYIKHSKIKEVTKNSFTTKEGITTLLKDMEVYCKFLEKVKNNVYTQPLTDEILMFADKYRWFLKSTK